MANFKIPLGYIVAKDTHTTDNFNSSTYHTDLAVMNSVLFGTADSIYLSSFQMLFDNLCPPMDSVVVKPFSPNVSPLTSLLVTFIYVFDFILYLSPCPSYPTSPPHPPPYPPSPTLYLSLSICYPSPHLHYLHPGINHHL